MSLQLQSKVYYHLPSALSLKWAAFPQAGFPSSGSRLLVCNPLTWRRFSRAEQLVLSVTKDTYEVLGLPGTPSRFPRRGAPAKHRERPLPPLPLPLLQFSPQLLWSICPPWPRALGATTWPHVCSERSPLPCASRAAVHHKVQPPHRCSRQGR